MYLTYLNHYNIRQCEAQYLDMFYQNLEKLPDTYYILNEDYLKKYTVAQRWEVRKVEQEWGKYEDLLRRLKPSSYIIMKKPEEMLDYKIPSQILFETANSIMPEQERTILELLEKKGGSIKAGITWVNNYTFKKTLNKFNIPTIHHELGPFRPTTYIPTAYLDFSGVNGNTEFNRRFVSFLKISDKVPILSRKELIRVLSPSHYQELHKILDNKIRPFEIGVGLQVEVDTNLLLFNNGCSWIDPVLMARSKAKRKVLVRPHPAAGFIMKSDGKLVVDNLENNAVEFINKCREIYCLNSSIGIEAMMLGREAKILGDSPFRNVCNMDEETKLKALNFIVFGYLIHRDLLFNDSYYDFRLTHRGDEKGIYLDNMQRLLKSAKGIKL